MKATQHSLFALLTATASACAGCVNLIEGSGRVISQERPFTPFKTLALEGSMDVHVARGKGAISVVTDDNLQPYVDVAVNGDRMTIREGRGPGGWLLWLDPTRGIDVQLTIPDSLTAIAVSGSGSLTWTGAQAMVVDSLALDESGSGSMNLDVDCSRLSASVSGSGSMTLRGSASTSTYDLDGSGRVHAFDLASRTATVAVSGSGSAELSVSDALDADVSGSGSVLYKGSPRLTTRTSGSGGIRNVD